MSRFTMVVLGAVLAALALSACGSSSNKSGISKDELARRVFNAKVNAVCVATNNVTDGTQPKKLSEVPTAAATLVPAQRAQLVTLRGIASPAEIKPAWTRVLDLLQQQVTLLDQVQTEAAHKTTVRKVSADVQLLNAATVEGQSRSVALGLPNCGT